MCGFVGYLVVNVQLRMVLLSCLPPSESQSSSCCLIWVKGPDLKMKGLEARRGGCKCIGGWACECLCVCSCIHAPSVLLFTFERRSEALSALIGAGLGLCVMLPYAPLRSTKSQMQPQTPMYHVFEVVTLTDMHVSCPLGARLGLALQPCECL